MLTVFPRIIASIVLAEKTDDGLLLNELVRDAEAVAEVPEKWERERERMPASLEIMPWAHFFSDRLQR